MSGWEGTGGRSLAHRNPQLRRAILARDPICRACGQAPSTEVDHDLEVADGGTDHPSNLRGICVPCHKRKTAAHAASKRKSAQRAPEKHPGLR